jgi:DNA-binding NarL/FixJ family response regulator
MKKISVIIVEDHKMIREMFANMFAGKEEIEVIGQSGEFNEAIELIKTAKPDIVLLDINLSENSGMDAVPLIRQFAPSSRIVAVSMHSQPSYAKKMIKLGARGYVTKSSSHQEILEAVEEVMKGNLYVCREIRNTLTSQALGEQSDGTQIKSLSLREIEIIRLIRKGLSSREIAASLYIAVRTVEVHRYNILKKLSLKNTASLISFINNSDLGL